MRGWLCEHRRTMQDLILQRLEQGRRDGEIGPGADLAALAAFYATVLHGMSIQARDGADRAALQAVARQAMHAWDALAHPPAAAR
ncbi:TetR family transcriptional regulator [Bordetella pertussis]|nr:TetR family transcriptional regulator [Bordetella pertussis]